MTDIRLVIVEDDEPLREALTRELSDVGFAVRAFRSAEGVPGACREFAPEVALIDLRLPGRSGFELLHELRASRDEIQVVMLTGHGGVAEAVQAMRLGAYDFLVKPTRLQVLEQSVRRAAERGRLLRENARLRRVAGSAAADDELLGESAAIERVRSLVARIAPSDEPVLIQGENGTGKELIASQLQRASARAGRPYVIVNCGAIPADLVESEIFGHERGAFTGADRQRVGLLEAADGGTLLLDEVGELPLAVQPVLLRAVQSGEIRPVGSTRTRTVDVRLLAATNRDLRAEVEAGRFREDLYHRLSTFLIEVPPLRERPEDIGLLARIFLARASARADRRLVLNDAAMARLASEPWSGNVRELQNAITRLSVLVADEVITAEHVERVALGAGLPVRGTLPTLRIAELQRLATEAALERHDGDKRAAAEELGVSLRTLYNWLE